MSRVVTILSGLSLLLTSACSSPLVAVAVSKVFGSTSPAVVLPPEGAPEISVSLPARGTQVTMALLDRDGPVSIWAAKDGTQIFLRDGFLIGTRGLGRDLMSADAPSMADLRAMKPHARHYFDLDGADTTIRFDFACAVVPGDSAGAIPGTTHLVELCANPKGTLRNEFWLKPSGSAQKSAQWVSTGVGYAVIEAK